MKRSLLTAAAAITFAGITFISCTGEVSSKPNFIFKAATDNSVAAEFDGVKISNADLTKGIELDIYEQEMKVYEIKFNRLRQILIERLMEKDPNKKGMTNDEYLEKYITSKISVSEKDVAAFVKQRNIPKEHINAQMTGRIEQFLAVEKKKSAIESWLAKKTSKNAVSVYLKKPMRPVFDVKAGDSPFIGNADAKVTIVEFSDFQCPFCKKGADVMNEVKKKYGNKVKIVFRNFPLPFHKQAQKAAEAALCANEQGSKNFWKVHDHMFENQQSLAVAQLKETAKKIGLDSKKFDDCLDSSKYSAQVNKDMEHGKSVGVKSTPTFFVNGKIVAGALPLESFSELIDEELKK